MTIKKLLTMAAAVLCAGSMWAKSDVTETYVTDADLASLNGWGNPGRTAWNTEGATNVVEFWNWSNQFSFTQNVQLPEGYYRLAVNAFYRNSWTGDGTNNNMAWILAGSKTQNVVALTNMTELSGYAGSNDLFRAATAFSQGKYSNEFDFHITADDYDEGKSYVTIEIGFKGTCPNGGWCILGPVKLWQYELEDYMTDYRAKVSEAEALYTTPMYSGALAALKTAVVEESTLTTIDEVISQVTVLSNAINAANASILQYASDIAPFNTLKANADAIAAVAYTETTSESHATFTAAITAQQNAADAATDVAAINAAITALKAAIKNYIANAEPANDGEYFDITCLMVNPDFDNNNINGWTKESSLNPNTRIQCNEFFGTAAFDFYQTIDNLPNGSYTLSMKAFQRPGGYNEVYTDYNKGINNATAKVYVNSDASVVMNIMEEMNNTRIYTDPSGEDAFNSDKQPTGASGYIPNSMEGAAAWFAAGKYQKEVAAIVEDGNLRLGFKDDAHSGDVWTLFDEFRLHYYGSSKMIYYKQYLPQLIAEVSADLTNALYANVTGKEREDLTAALGVDDSGFTTEEDYSDAINAIKDAQTAFESAYPSYDALVAANAATLTKVSANIGTGVFQYNETTNNTLWSVYETAKAAVDNYTVTTTSTATAIQDIVDAYNTAVSNYNNQALNAPAAGTRYYLTVATSGHAKEGNAIVVTLGATSDNNKTGYGFNAAATPVAYLAQAFIFTQVSGNTYNISVERPEGTVYLTYGSLNNSAAGWATQQIQGTTDASAKGEFKIEASTTTDGVFYIYNTVDNNYIDCQDGGSLYTDTDIDKKDFRLEVATQASATLAAKAGKFGTFVAPFAVTIPTGIEAYKVTAENEGKLTLEVVETTIPANTAVLVKNTTASDFSEVQSGWGTAAADSYATELLTGVYTAATITASAGNTTNYVLQTAADETQAFYKVDADFTATANKCYLTVTTSGEAKPRVLYFDEADATAIDEIVNGKSVNGQSIYNLNGQQLNSLQRGINIVGGKKVLVK
jgi:hypothetical protein